MKTGKQMKQLGCALILAAVASAWGCESVGILERESIARRDRDRSDERRDRIYGVVQDVDERRREVRVRTDDGRSMTVRYDNSTRILNGDREIKIDALRAGDQVSVRLDRDSRGDQYAQNIRIEDRRGSWWRW
jgi:hypothetical protein